MCIDWAVNWLDHSRTFREQGVEESETLLLRRKFFYSDQNVDSRDPVQLNLLYVQVNQLLTPLCCFSKRTLEREDDLLYSHIFLLLQPNLQNEAQAGCTYELHCEFRGVFF